ncbi:MAG: tetratricopeptide repeat protein, partial [bacterium]|nr:tetratricopeptide repeat protein [bacterium]
MRKKHLFILVFFIFNLTLHAGSINDIAVGSRPAGLARSFTGVANDANAAFYNTAGSAYLEKSELTFQNIFFNEKMNSFNFLGFNQILGKNGTFNLGFFKSSLEQGTDNINALNLGFGQNVFWFMALGMNLQVFNQAYHGRNNNQVDIDMSLYLDPILKKKKEIQDLMLKTKKFIENNSGSALKMGIEAYRQKRYIEAAGLFSESLKYDPNNDKARDYLSRCMKATGLDIAIPPRVNLRSSAVLRNLSLQERERLADKEYREGLEYYYKENYILALQSWQRALDILYMNKTVDRMKIGLSVHNLFRHKYLKGGLFYREPVRVNAGMIYYVLSSLGLVAEFTKSEGTANKLGLNAGLEFDPFDFITMRVGLCFAQPITFQNRRNSYTAGLGLHYRNYTVDYAFEPNNSLYSHSFSLSIRFGASKEESALVHLNQGVIYAKNGRTEEAEQEWKDALLLDPNQVIARQYLKGELNVLDAEVRKKEKDDSVGVFRKGLDHYNQKDYLKARAYFVEALVINSQNTQANVYYEKVRSLIQVIKSELLVRGKDYMAQMDWENAVVSFNQVLKYDSQNKEAQEMLDESMKKFMKKLLVHKQNAVTLYHNRMFPDARKEIELFLKFQPDDQEALEQKFRINQAIEKKQLQGDCEKLYEESLTFFSNRNYFKTKELLLKVEETCRDFRDTKEWIALCDREIEKEKNTLQKEKRAQEYFKEGLQKYQNKQYEQALSLFRQALTLSPRMTEAGNYIHESESRIIQGMKKTEQTKKASDLYSESLSLIEKENYNEALKKLNLAVLMDDRNQLVKEKIKEVNGWIQLKIERPYEEGVRDFNEGMLSKAIEKWQLVLKMQPDHDLAKMYLAKAMGQKSQSIRIHNQLGQEYMNKNEHGKAIREFREVLALEPENGTAGTGLKKAQEVLGDRISSLFRKGEELFKDRKYSEARSEFQKVLDLDPGDRPSLQY